MAFITIDEVRQAAAAATFTRAADSDTVIATNAETYFEKKASDDSRLPVTHFDIFLSHAYVDRIIVAGLYSLLQGTGFTVYVDWIHDRHRINRTSVTSANAAILRKRMGQCKSLLYATTQNHSTSKWMPWECGFFDGFDSKPLPEGRQPGHVAILPVLSSASSQFSGQEYLGLYPIAQKGSLSRRNLNIHNQQTPSRYFHFDAWVANGHP